MYFQKETLSRLSTVVPDLFADVNDTEKYARNLIKLEIFYEELNFRTVTETPAYTVWDCWIVILNKYFLSYNKGDGNILSLYIPWLGNVLIFFRFFDYTTVIISYHCLNNLIVYYSLVVAIS